MCDPQKLSVIDELRSFLGYEVRAVVATEKDVLKALTRYYAAGGESVESLIADMEQDTDLAAAAAALEKGVLDLTGAEALADSAPVRKLLNMVLLMAIKDQASDMHFEPFENEFKIRIRADGVLYEMVPPPRHLAFAITTRIKVMANLDIAERRVPQDGRIRLTVGGHPVDLRVSVLPTMFGESVVMRVLDRSVVMLDLGVVGMEAVTLAAFREIIRRPNGIVLVTGPTGSRQDDHALRRLERTQRDRGQAHHHRGPGGVRDRRHRADPHRRRRSATRSPSACGRSCGRTRTRSWWARSATWRRPRSPCRPR